MSTAKRPGPAGGPRDLNRRRNQQRLQAAALALFLRHGIAAVSIDDIVARAKFAKGSFYRYATGKPDLVAQLLAPVTAELDAALDACALALEHARTDTIAATYVALAHALAGVVVRHAPRVLLYLQEARAPSAAAAPAVVAIADRLATRAIALTQVAIDHGLVRPVDAEVSARATLGAIDALLFVYLRRAEHDAAEIPRVIAELVAFVMRGIGATAPSSPPPAARRRRGSDRRAP